MCWRPEQNKRQRKEEFAPFFPLPHLSWDVSFPLLLLLDWNLHLWPPWFLGLQSGTELHHWSPACREQIVALPGFHQHMSQFLIIKLHIYPIGSVSLENSDWYSVHFFFHSLWTILLLKYWNITCWKLCKHNIFSFFPFFFFWLCCTACGNLVPQPGIETMPPALEAWGLNHWTTREFPTTYFLKSFQITNSCSFPDIFLLIIYSSDLYPKKQIVLVPSALCSQVKQNAFTFVNIHSWNVIAPSFFLFFFTFILTEPSSIPEQSVLLVCAQLWKCILISSLFPKVMTLA